MCVSNNGCVRESPAWDIHISLPIIGEETRSEKLRGHHYISSAIIFLFSHVVSACFETMTGSISPRLCQSFKLMNDLKPEVWNGLCKLQNKNDIIIITCYVVVVAACNSIRPTYFTYYTYQLLKSITSCTYWLYFTNLHFSVKYDIIVHADWDQVHWLLIIWERLEGRLFMKQVLLVTQGVL